MKNRSSVKNIKSKKTPMNSNLKGNKNHKQIHGSRSIHSSVGGRQESVPKSDRTIVGHHACRELLSVNARDIQIAWLKQGWESSNELRDFHETLVKNRIKVEIKPTVALDKVSSSNQGLVLFVNNQPEFDHEKIAGLDSATLVLADGVEDPHNLGAILRTAWLSNASGVMIPQDRAVGLTATVHKVACGGVEHVPVLETTNFSNTVEKLKEAGFWVFGLSHKAKRTIYDLELPEKVIWAVGAEDKGLRTTTEKLCDELVSIPQVSAAASYNASVAVGITLGETQRQILNRSALSLNKKNI